MHKIYTCIHICTSIYKGASIHILYTNVGFLRQSPVVEAHTMFANLEYPERRNAKHMIRMWPPSQ